MYRNCLRFGSYQSRLVVDSVTYLASVTLFQELSQASRLSSHCIAALVPDCWTLGLTVM